MSHRLLSACGASQKYGSMEAGWAADGRPPSLHRTEPMSRAAASRHRKGFAKGVKNATNHFPGVDWETARSSPVEARESFLHAVAHHMIRE